MNKQQYEYRYLVLKSIYMNIKMSTTVGDLKNCNILLDRFFSILLKEEDKSCNNLNNLLTMHNELQLYVKSMLKASEVFKKSRKRFEDDVQ